VAISEGPTDELPRQGRGAFSYSKGGISVARLLGGGEPKAIYGVILLLED